MYKLILSIMAASFSLGCSSGNNDQNNTTGSGQVYETGIEVCVRLQKEMVAEHGDWDDVKITFNKVSYYYGGKAEDYDGANPFGSVRLYWVSQPSTVTDICESNLPNKEPQLLIAESALKVNQS